MADSPHSSRYTVEMTRSRQTKHSLESLQPTASPSTPAGGIAPASHIHLPPVKPDAEVIAHRTAGRLAPENTLAGLFACIRHGCQWAEVDVRTTADGHHVLIHDETVDRTTNGVGRVADLTLGQIQQLRLTDSERVPTLREALDAARGRTRLYLDCRDVHPGRLTAELREAGMLEEVMVFIDPCQYQELRTAGGRQLLLVAFFDQPADQLPPSNASGGPLALEIPAARLDERLIEAAARRSLPVECLALGPEDHPATWNRVISLGVRWVMTDFPDQWAGIFSHDPSRNV